MNEAAVKSIRTVTEYTLAELESLPDRLSQSYGNIPNYKSHLRYV